MHDRNENWIVKNPGKFFLLYLFLSLWTGVIGGVLGTTEQFFWEFSQREFWFLVSFLCLVTGIALPSVIRWFEHNVRQD